MIATENFLFIHTPKCAGMSISNWLLEVLNGTIYYYAPEGHFNGQYNERVIFKKGIRHENLQQARERLNEILIDVQKIELILTTIRNPYELELSRYNYLKLGHSWDKGVAQDIATNYGFNAFAKHAPFMGKSVVNFHIEDFYLIDGEIPSNLKIVKYEEINTIPQLIKKFIAKDVQIPHINSTTTEKINIEEYYNKDTELAIFYKYRWIFEMGFYKRLEL